VRTSRAIDQLLDNASQLGTLESEGSFTIAGEAAIGKLAAFQLPRSSAWILKIVQAAVVNRAPELRIRQGNETTAFTFQTSDGFQIEDLKQALLSPQGRGALLVDHLAVGLRAVGFGDRRAFTLAFDCGNNRTLFGWDGQQLAQKTQILEQSSPPTLNLGVAFPSEDLGRSFGGLVKSRGRATTEYQEVVTHCEVCPIPLFFDGRRLDKLNAPPRDDLMGDNAVISVGWAPPRKGVELPSFRLPQGLLKEQPKWKPTDKFTDNRVFLVDGDTGQSEVSCLAKLRYSYKIISHRGKYKSFEFQAINRRSYYNWVKDGVICQKEASMWEQAPISFEAYFSADDLETDISGLRLLETPIRHRRKNLAREHVLFQAENTLEALLGHTPKPFSLHTAIFGTAGALCTLLAPFTFGKSLMGTVLLINLAVSAADKKKILDDCRHHLRRFGDRLKNPEPTSRAGRRY
jgi:hypothetical protein